MTMPADPNVFDPLKKKVPPPGAPAPVTSAAPAPAQPPPAGSSFIAGDATPPNNPDLDPATGQPRQITGGVDQNGQPTSIIRNSDGSAVVTQNGQIVQRIAANGQVTTGAAPAPSPTAVGGGTGGGVILPNGRQAVLDPATNTYRYPDGTQVGWDQVQSLISGGGRDVANAGALGSNIPGASGGSTISNTPVASTNAAINNQALINRNALQTTGDIARVAEAGGAAQATIGAAGQQALATGQGIYQDAQTARLEALARGDAGLATSQAQGAAAQTTARDVAAPLFNLGANEQVFAADARDQGNRQVNAANTYLGSAATSTQRLQELAAAGDPEATAALRNFTGSAGTANQLGAFNPTTATNLNAFDPSQGMAAALAATNPNYSATGALDSFEGDRATAEELRTLPTGVSATNALGGYQPNNGTAPALEGLPTETSATGNLLGFMGSRGTADDLRGFRTGAAATGDLANFAGNGGLSLDQLERLSRGEDIGPSAAEALLKKQSDQTQAANIALARSGRGAGNAASSLRQAAFVNAKEQQDLGTNLSALRANEAAAARGQNITAATAAAGTRTALSGQDLAALQSRQAGELAAEKNKLDALVASGQLTQQQAAQQLESLKAAQAAQTAAVGQKSTNLTNAGAQYQTQSQQRIQALTAQQQGQLQAERDKLDALVASGQMTQAAANQRLTALQAEQQGQIAAEGQRIQAVTSAGAQMQTASAQQIDAMKAQQSTEMQGESLRLQGLVASGQMSQKQADQQLAALQSTQQGQLAAEQNRIAASTAAGSTANASAGVSADLAKAFANLGLQYDAQSGQVYNQAGQLVQGGDKIAADLLANGLQNQVGQGSNAVSAANAGMSALTSLTNTNVDAQRAVGVIGTTTAAQIAGLSQAQLAELDNIVSRQNKQELETWAAVNGLTLSNDQMNAQQTGAIFGAVGTIIGGLAGLAAGGPAGAAAGAAAGGAGGSALGRAVG